MKRNLTLLLLTFLAGLALLLAANAPRVAEARAHEAAARAMATQATVTGLAVAGLVFLAVILALVLLAVSGLLIYLHVASAHPHGGHQQGDYRQSDYRPVRLPYPTGRWRDSYHPLPYYANSLPAEPTHPGWAQPRRIRRRYSWPAEAEPNNYQPAGYPIPGYGPDHTLPAGYQPLAPLPEDYPSTRRSPAGWHRRSCHGDHSQPPAAEPENWPPDWQQWEERPWDIES